MQTVHTINLIISDPAIRTGRPVIAGTTLCVSDLVIAMNFHGQDPDGIAAWYDISLAQVHAALAYYYQHQADIDASIQEQIKQGEEQKASRAGSRH